jgi:hypothetical protein
MPKSNEVNHGRNVDDVRKRIRCRSSRVPYDIVDVLIEIGTSEIAGIPGTRSYLR